MVPISRKLGFQTKTLPPASALKKQKQHPGYSLFTLSLDGTTPHFTHKAKEGRNEEKGLSIYYSPQCPYSLPRIEKLKAYVEKNNIPYHFHYVDTLEKAKEVPSAFNNWAVFYNGVFQTVNQIDEKTVEKMLKK